MNEAIVSNGFCPNCSFQNMQNEMYLNTDNVFECPECHIQMKSYTNSIGFLPVKGEGLYKVNKESACRYFKNLRYAKNLLSDEDRSKLRKLFQDRIETKIKENIDGIIKVLFYYKHIELFTEPDFDSEEFDADDTLKRNWETKSAKKTFKTVKIQEMLMKENESYIIEINNVINVCNKNYDPIIKNKTKNIYAQKDLQYIENEYLSISENELNNYSLNENFIYSTEELIRTISLIK